MTREFDTLGMSEKVTGVVGVIAFASIGYFGINAYRADLAADIERSSAALSTLAQESDSYTKSLPPACTDLIFQLMPHTKSWRETADRVAESGLCGAGSDGIVTKLYTYDEQLKGLRTHITDKSNELNGWAGQIIYGSFVAGFIGTVIGKAAGFTAFCIAESMIERTERKERDRRYNLLLKRAAQTWHNPDEANDPGEPKVNDSGPSADSN